MDFDASQSLPLPAEQDLVIETARLTLRPLRPLRREHADELFAILADPALYEFMGGAPPASVEELRELYTACESRRSPDDRDLWLNWATVERNSGEAIGYMQASVAGKRAHVAWVVGTGWQGRGYTSESAIALIQWLRSQGVTHVWAKIHPNHTASQKVAMRGGLRRTGEMFDREEVWRMDAGQA